MRELLLIVSYDGDSSMKRGGLKWFKRQFKRPFKRLRSFWISLLQSLPIIYSNTVIMQLLINTKNVIYTINTKVG
jgi:hypothetical protein